MFIIDGKNNVRVDPEYLLIPEFNTIYKDDRTAQKHASSKEFAYIYFLLDPRSKYRDQYSGEELVRQVNIQFLKDEKYKPPLRVRKGMEVYKSLLPNKEYKLYVTADRFLDQLRSKLETGINDIDKLSTKEVTEYIKLMEEIPRAQNTYRAAKKAVLEDLTGKMSGKKDKLIGRFEKPINVDEFDLDNLL